tara:strand:- start:221 stop:820 length:600 start_codon:yes stop_codon:yes gene_type:complete
MSCFFTDLEPPEYPIMNVKDFVDDELLRKVETYIDKQVLDESTMQGHGNVTDELYRRSKIHWMMEGNNLQKLLPVYKELTFKIRDINNRNWRYVIDGWEPFQYTEYDESYDGHYDWHIDHQPKTPFEPNIRKLSFSLGISDIDDYEGGDLHIKMRSEENVYKLSRGEIVIFPSWMLHKVSSVTKGRRRVIVGWGQGPFV